MILINEISLTNFESIESLHLTFDNHQMTSIRGENGSGKSTLFHAIAFLLFNYKKGDSYRSYVRLGADEAHLEMTALLDGSPVTYDVTIKAEGRSGTPVTRKVIYKDTIYGTSDYSKFIKDNNLDHLEEIMFLFQDSTSIIEARPAERAAMLRKLFNLDFSSYAARLKDEQEENKIGIVEHNTILKDLQGRTYEKQPLTREVPTALVTTWEERLDEINKELSTLNSFNTQDLSDCCRSIAECERLLSSEKGKLQLKTSELARRQTSLKEYTESYTSLLAGVDSDTYRKNISNRLEDIARQSEEAELKRTEHAAALTDIDKQLSVLRYSIDENKKHLASSSSGTCHSCGQPIDSNHLLKLQKEKEELQLRFDAEKLRRDSEEVAVRELQQSIRGFQAETSQLSDKLSQEETRRINIATATVQITDLQDLIETLQRSIDGYESKLSQLNEKKHALEELEQSQEKLRNLENEKKDLELKIRNANAVVISNTERKRFNEEIDKRRKEDTERARDAADKLNTLQVNTSVNKTCIDIFENKLPNYIILRVCKDLEGFINDVVQRAFPYITVELRADRSGVNFFYKTDTSKEVISISMASGAQKRIITLAYQIALASLFNTGAIFLDEIDASMSSTSATIVYDFISSLCNFDQVFFISHRQESFAAVQDSNPSVVFYSVDKGVYERED